MVQIKRTYCLYERGHYRRVNVSLLSLVHNCDCTIALLFPLASASTYHLTIQPLIMHDEELGLA